MQEKGGVWGKVYLEIMSDPNFSPAAKEVYAYLAARCGASDECYPSVETIIGFNAAEDIAELYTADPVWIRKMDELAAQNPEQFKPGRVEKCQGEVFAKRYILSKWFISIRTKTRYQR